MKKIYLSLGIIAIVAIGAVGATRAFFSDTETSSGNTFTAGAIDLQVGSECTFNNEESGECGEWEGLKDLITSDKFFTFDDIKPGDEGKNTISLKVLNNDAYLCAAVSNLESKDNTQTEPESEVDNNDDEGELDNEMVWTISLNGTEVLSGNPTDGILALYDSSSTALSVGSTALLDVEWSLPAISGNETQTDSLTGDISFYTVQSRNNNEFKCSEDWIPAGQQPSVTFVYNEESTGDSQNDNTGPSYEYTEPHVTWTIDGDEITFDFYNDTPWLYVFDVKIDGEAGVDRIDGSTNLTNLNIGGGPLAGQQFGPTYHRVVVDGRPATNTHHVTQTFSGNSEIKVGLREGAENNLYFDWLTFNAS